MNREEIMRILNLIYEKKITPDQGFDLMEELIKVVETKQKMARRLKIEVFNKLKNKTEVNITLPAKLASFASKFMKGKSFKIGSNDLDVDLDIDMDELIKEAMSTGETINVDTDEYRIEIRFEE
ncbi:MULTISPECIES: hypothetical protein [Kosmotoga]|uniref:Uncharacterized protein n=1 Tax=Kosmotoga olearia (strain ATCC BAA-1733 / DSM 21960 / TBF 19.5.1) TaxID=521045 RepID=C5CG79_KOSOT|nr:MULTISPECIES: hypothetical protein [Kosmotoga]ACR79520.1 hypothetical protein Kole_0809 [Kosmotoga olearia TBF 19.5.1]MDI3524227.1 hypothetical protein [Kosmotoga sp.]MDK2953262.1 hypothetical protein [Kosmotoga sp.]OAA22080.1 hypothetical protein DU53_04320 [Kosmotoga sp. DU53]